MGVDVAVEALGRTQTFGQCVQSVRDGGKAVMIGLTLSGAKGEVDINHLVRRQVCASCATINFSFSAFSLRKHFLCFARKVLVYFIVGKTTKNLSPPLQNIGDGKMQVKLPIKRNKFRF